MIKTGLFRRGSNLHPKIERTKKDELIYVFADIKNQLNNL